LRIGSYWAGVYTRYSRSSPEIAEWKKWRATAPRATSERGVHAFSPGTSTLLWLTPEYEGHARRLEGSAIASPSTRNEYAYRSGFRAPVVTDQTPSSSFRMAMGSGVMPRTSTARAFGARRRNVTPSAETSGDVTGWGPGKRGCVARGSCPLACTAKASTVVAESFISRVIVSSIVRGAAAS
jgi:hypothetical protein